MSQEQQKSRNSPKVVANFRLVAQNDEAAWRESQEVFDVVFSLRANRFGQSANIAVRSGISRLRYKAKSISAGLSSALEHCNLRQARKGPPGTNSLSSHLRCPSMAMRTIESSRLRCSPHTVLTVQMYIMPMLAAETHQNRVQVSAIQVEPLHSLQKGHLGGGRHLPTSRRQ